MMMMNYSEMMIKDDDYHGEGGGEEAEGEA